MTSGPSFTYLFAHPETLAVTVRTPAALALLLLIALLLGLARRDFRHHRLALGCRIAAFTLLVLALAGVALSARLPSRRLSLVAVADVSESIDAVGRKWEERYLKRIAAALGPDDELGIVAFAKDARVLRPPGVRGTVTLSGPHVSATATDIGKALQTAMALLPADAARRLLLISDGNETRGSALEQVARARRAAVSIYATVPPHVGVADVAVEKLAVAPLVTEGSVFPVRVVLRSRGKARPVVLRLFVDAKSVGQATITLQPGLNAVEIPYRMAEAGSHRLRAQLAAAGDGTPGNDYREVPIMVGGQARVLLVSPRSRPSLARVLARKNISVTTVAPRQFPTRIGDLVRYHGIIFGDVTPRALRPGSLRVLERYVKDFGGGFILAAGDATYGDRRFKKTAFERLLPVTLEPRRPPRAEREPLALFILIDRSNSMGYHIRKRTVRSEDESKLAYARRAALAVVTQLKDNDMVGLIAFDSQPFEVSPLLSLKESRDTLVQDIPRLQPGGGTDFY
ncbi:MAG: VWA domain-containing protein, partial [Candidatus Binatia bacterium]